jgi:hypothetical protein
MQTGTKDSTRRLYVCMYVVGLGHYVRILFGILYTPPKEDNR